MTQAATAISHDTEVMRMTNNFTDYCLRANVEGLTHEDSLVQPPAGANCLNWVVGHLACVYNEALPMLGQEPVGNKDAVKRYARGSKPVLDGSDALPFSELLANCYEASKRVEAGLNSMSSSKLDAPAPFSPSKNPKETVRSLLTTVLFHQAYHAGQTGLLRRLAGKSGAIA